MPFRRRLSAVALFAILTLLSLWMPALAQSPPVANGSFETPSVGNASYQYNPTGGSWTFTGDSGIQSNGSTWNAASATDGTQTAFLQGYPGAGGLASLSQTVTFASAGTYTLTFQAARRQGQIQPVKVSVDGVQVGSLLTPPGSSFGPLTTAVFTISNAGSHTITLAATDNSSDLTTFVDQVSITQTAVPPLVNSSFESPGVGTANYQYTPTGVGWTFSGYSGIQSNGSIWGAGNAPDGTQTAFLQGYPGTGTLGSISQTVNFSSTGSYALSFQAAQRQGQVQPVVFSVDGVQVGSLLTPPSSFGLLTSAPFTISTTGNHTITLAATNNSSDLTTFVDQVSVTPVTAIPAAPIGFNAVAGNGQITLTWTASPGATSYNLYRGTSPGGEGTIPFQTGLTGTSYTDTMIAPGIPYYYTLTALNTAGESAASGESAAPSPVSHGTYTVQYSGGTVTATNAPDGSFTPSGGVYSASISASGSSGVTTLSAQCSGSLIAKFTWVPDPNYPDSPPPLQVIVGQTCTASWTIQGYASSFTGTCDTGLGPKRTTTSGGLSDSVTGSSATVVPNPGQGFTLTRPCNPTGTVTISTNAICSYVSASVSYTPLS